MFKKNIKIPCCSIDSPSWSCSISRSVRCSAQALISNAIVDYHVRGIRECLKEMKEEGEKSISARIRRLASKVLEYNKKAYVTVQVQESGQLNYTPTSR